MQRELGGSEIWKMQAIWLEVGRTILEGTAKNPDLNKEKLLQIAKDMAYLGIGSLNI